jgi:Rps23 Pro-64 3,4-dihydroxylase Tpa1-like proline 4-hydroxylase
MLEPSPHLLIPDFLGQNLVDRLIGHCVGNEARFVATAVGDGHTATLDYGLRRSSTLAQADDFTRALQQTFQARLAALLPTITAALGLSAFVPTTYEMEVTAHNDGAFFGKHIDTFTGRADLPAQRMVTAVYYFFARPKRFSGGALRLYPLLDASDTSGFIDIEPVNDGLICFPSFAPHAVQPIACPSGAFAASRFAINNWICRAPPPSRRAD